MLTKNNNISIDELSSIFKSLKTDDVVSVLELLRTPLLKLSETNIPKHQFFQWKKAKYLDSLFPPQNQKVGKSDKKEKEWTIFSVMQTVILSFVKILWERNLESKIKEFVDEYMLGDDFDNQLKSYLQEDGDMLEKVFNKSKYEDILGFMYYQKKVNPHLPSMTNIEGLIFASLKLDRPSSIIIHENNTIEVLVTSKLTDLLGVSLYNDLLKKTFISISISQVVNNVIYGNKDETTIAKQETAITKLLIAGYDIATLNELLNKGNELEYIEEKLDAKRNIEKVFLDNRNDDQDIILKIRGGEKVSLRRVIIKTKV